MILEYEQFAKKLDAKLFEGNSKGLIEKIVKYIKAEDHYEVIDNEGDFL